MRKNKRTCKICGNSEAYLKEYTKTIESEWKRLEIPHYKVTQCDACNEAIAEQESVEKREPLIRDFYREIDLNKNNYRKTTVKEFLGLSKEENEIVENMVKNKLNNKKLLM